MAATAPWTAAADFPVNGSPRDKLGFAVKLATLASVEQHHPKPWQFEIADRFVELFASPQLAAHNSAPDEREAMIHSGTALQYLQFAMKRHHCFGRVELFPDLDQPALAARVHPGTSSARDVQEQQLAAAMEVGEPASPRLELPGNAVPLDVLSRAMAGERGWLEFARSDQSRQRLVEVLNPSRRMQVNEIRLHNETLVRSSVGAWESAAFTGTTLHERFSRWRRPAFAIKVRGTTPAMPVAPVVSDSDATTGTFAVLKTKTDDKHGWLAAGQILARLLLHVRAAGLTCTPYLDALQQPELRSELRTAIGHKGFTQVILRFTGLPIETPLPSVARYATTATGSTT